ncbi:MAG: cation transporter [Planctomycetota bacterium]
MTERGALLVSAATALIVGIAGTSAYFVVESQAVLLDGLFNLTYFVTALVTLRVVKLVAEPESDDYPLGLAYLEPLVNGIKGVLIFGISAIALLDAVAAIFGGGRTIQVGPALVYAIFATTAGVVATVILKRAEKSTGSSLVAADAASWSVNALISGGVMLTFLSIPLVRSWFGDGILPYVDPALVGLIVLISIGVPIRMARTALLAMLNRAPDAPQRAVVAEAVREGLADVPVESVETRMIYPGRRLFVAVTVLVPRDHAPGSIADLDALRWRVQDSVRKVHPDSSVETTFTADPRWASGEWLLDTPTEGVAEGEPAAGA